MKLFWANLLTFLFLLPCLVSIFFMVQLWDKLSIAGTWLFFGLAGPAITAMHFIAIKAARGRPIWLWPDYKECMQREWKKAVVLSLIVGGLWLFLIDTVRTMYVLQEGISLPMLMLLFLCGFLLSGFSLFSYQQLAMVSLPFHGVLRNGILLIFAGKGRSFAAVLLAYMVILLCLYYYRVAPFFLLLGFYALTVMTVNLIFLPCFEELFPLEEEDA